jgi:hypothetical protein
MQLNKKDLDILLTCDGKGKEEKILALKRILDDISDEDFKKLLEEAHFEELNKVGVNFIRPDELKDQ